MNFFASILTNNAPSANYRGENQNNRTTLQRITKGRFEYAVISPEAVRNALRECLRRYAGEANGGLELNRERLHNEEQLAVRFNDYPDPAKYADDFLFGYMVADRKQVPAEVIKARGGFQFKRDSVIRTNMAVALEPYRHDFLLTQSPLTIKNDTAPWQNSASSALLNRETSVTAFQYPLAVNLADCELTDDEGGRLRQGWLRSLLRAISELTDVAGNHARSYFPMQPASIVIRLTNRLTPDFDLYGFHPDGSFPDLIGSLLSGGLPGDQFILAGDLVRNVLTDDEKGALVGRGVTVDERPERALDKVAMNITGAGFLPASAA